LYSYDFEYEDGDEENEENSSVENTYYVAKQLKSENAEEAIREFLSIPQNEKEKGDW